MIFDASTLKTRQSRTESLLKDVMKNGDVAVVFAGDPITKPGGLDQTYGFLPHPTHFWLTGRRRVSGAMTYSLNEGWVEFTKPFTREEALWEGGVPERNPGRDTAELAGYLKKFSRVFTLGQVPASMLALGQQAPEEERFQIQARFDRARRVKDAAEVALIEKVAAIAKRGYDRIEQVLRPGVTEREIRIEYEAEIQRAGALGVPYETIVGAGTNAAILHAIPTEKKIEAGEAVLIDAGAEIHDYCVDITRVYAADGRFTSQQQLIYDLVKSAQAQAIAMCKIGTEWNRVHTTTARVIAEGLKSLKILKGSADAALESGAIAVFYPHGVGHLVGLRVRDTGYLENRTPKKYCGVNLRVDLKLEEGFLITVEPGCYFVEAMYSDAATREKFKDFIDWNEAEKWRGHGGVRLEDDVLITAGAPKILTASIAK